MARLISRKRVVGPTDTKPDKVSGRVFTSAAARDRYVQEQGDKGLIVTTKSDSYVRKQRDDLKNDIERKAIAAGYKSEKHRMSEVQKKLKEERAKTT